MDTAENLRNNIIDKLLTISNKDYLSALYKLVEKGSAQPDLIKLSSQQIAMLNLSEEDILAGKLLSNKEVEESDSAWLKEL